MSSLDYICNFVKRLVDEKAAKIIRFMIEKNKEMSDDEIAKELKMKLNEVRTRLYTLFEHGLVKYRRVKVKESTWYTYYWRASIEDIEAIIMSRKRKTLEKLKHRLEFEKSNTFYVCPLENLRFTFDEALENEFLCPRCGTPLEYADNTAFIHILRKYIEKLEKSIKKGSSK